jgi:hypothetical protein
MSSYLDGSDSDEESSTTKVIPPSEEEIKEILSVNEIVKSEGNQAFSGGDYDLAIEKYTEAIENLKKYNLPPNNLLHLNRFVDLELGIVHTLCLT